LLESGEAVPKQVAAQCGFANADTLRRVFVRLVGDEQCVFVMLNRPAINVYT